MKKTIVCLAAVLAAGALYAQTKDAPLPAADTYSYSCCGARDLQGCGPRGSFKKSNFSGRGGRHLMRGPVDENLMREHLSRFGMSEADITKMVQLQQEMRALMDKAFTNVSTN